MARPHGRKRGPFEWGARPYDILTRQRHWRASCAAMGEKLPQEAGLEVLDIGTGPGGSAAALAAARPEIRVVGIDPSAEMLSLAAAARERWGLGERISLIRGDGAALPFANGSFRGVTAHSVLYLVDDREGLLAEVRRILAPDGRAVFMEPHAAAPVSSVLAALPSLRFFASMVGWRLMTRRKGGFDRRTLGETLAAAGFEVLSIEPVLGGLGLLAVASRGAEVI